MKTFWIQLGLVAATLLASARLMRGTSPRTQALRRLGLVAFAALAVLSILLPSLWTRAAHALGIGRGTDLVLYALVVAFLSYVATTFRRQRDLERTYTRLARRIAIAEARSREAEGPPPPLPTEEQT